MELELTVDNNGIIKSAIQVPSPNYNHRPKNQIVDSIIIHSISLPPYELGKQSTDNVIAFFQNRLDAMMHPYFKKICNTQVSSHLLVDRNGTCYQFVSTTNRAWHAGTSSFKGRDNCNDYSIGIELIGSDKESFTTKQYKTLRALCTSLQAQYPKITKDRIIGHCHVAPDRKTDPGPLFDWGFLNKR